MAFIHFMEFRSVDGTAILQRADEISTVIESVIRPRVGDPVTTIHLLLRNNNRVQVAGETRESLIRRLVAQGNIIVIEGDPLPPQEVPDDAEEFEAVD